LVACNFSNPCCDEITKEKEKPQEKMTIQEVTERKQWPRSRRTKKIREEKGEKKVPAALYFTHRCGHGWRLGSQLGEPDRRGAVDPY
jgi:hypothetical protein